MNNIFTFTSLLLLLLASPSTHVLAEQEPLAKQGEDLGMAATPGAAASISASIPSRNPPSPLAPPNTAAEVVKIPSEPVAEPAASDSYLSYFASFIYAAEEGDEAVYIPEPFDWKKVAMAFVPDPTAFRISLLAIALAVLMSPRVRKAILTYGGVVGICAWYAFRKALFRKEHHEKRRESIRINRTPSPIKKTKPTLSPLSEGKVSTTPPSKKVRECEERSDELIKRIRGTSAPNADTSVRNVYDVTNKAALSNVTNICSFATRFTRRRAPLAVSSGAHLRRRRGSETR